MDERRHEIILSPSSELLQLEADPTRLEQILANLLTNAAKYTEPGGRIELSTRRQGEDIVIAVRDSGIGIAPEVLPHIFDLFMQLDSSLERSRGGLGIGLALVMRLVELHGGSISVTSDGVGMGSEFLVRLPAANAADVELPALRARHSRLNAPAHAYSSLTTTWIPHEAWPHCSKPPVTRSRLPMTARPPSRWPEANGPR